MLLIWRLAKKDKLSKDDEERIKDYIEAQIEKAKVSFETLFRNSDFIFWVK